MPGVTLYKGTDGINSVSSPLRIKQGRGKLEGGIVELAAAVNVYVDDSKMVRRRRGATLLEEGIFHSLFCGENGECFVAQDRTSDAAIFKVLVSSASQIILEGVRSGLTKGARISWEQISTDTFYSNGTENGYIRDGVSYDWPVGEYVGPKTDAHFSPAPAGNHIAIQAGGLMFILKGDAMYITHKPFEYGLFNLKSGVVRFASKAIMVCPVEAGVFVSDQGSTWFLRGTSWFDFRQERVADYPAVEWSLAAKKLRLSDLGLEGNGFARIWASKEGICAGLSDGTMLNLTEKRIKLGSGYSSGATVVCGKHAGCSNQIISTLFA